MGAAVMTNSKRRELIRGMVRGIAPDMLRCVELWAGTCISSFVPAQTIRPFTAVRYIEGDTQMRAEPIR